MRMRNILLNIIQAMLGRLLVALGILFLIFLVLLRVNLLLVLQRILQPICLTKLRMLFLISFLIGKILLLIPTFIVIRRIRLVQVESEINVIRTLQLACKAPKKYLKE